MRTHEIDESKVWKQDAISQMCFVRDTLCNYLLRVPVFVVSTHRSKSIDLPVYYFEMRNGIRAIMRENFHGWVVTLLLPFPVTLEDFCHGHGGEPFIEDIRPCYAEGFRPSWVHPYVKENARRTTFTVDGDYKLYTLFYLLNKLPGGKEWDGEVVMGSRFSKVIMEGIIEDHPNMRPFELFGRPIFKAESKGLGWVHIDSDKILEELPKRIDESAEVAKEFHIEMSLLTSGGKFE